MGEGPPIRGSSTKPPPPPARAPIAPSPAKTDVVAAQRDPREMDEKWERGDEASEITKNLEAPDAGLLVQHMLELVASEAEALLTAEDTDGRLADLNVRTALASWDGLHEPDEAMRYLELAETHPLSPRLRLMAALGQGAPESLAQAQSKIEAGASTGLLVELAEAWLFRHGKAEAAATLTDRLLVDRVAPAWRWHVTELAALAHAAAGNWARVVDIRRAALADQAGLDEVAAAASLVLDRAKDATGALAMCWDAIERIDGGDADVRDTQPSAAINRSGHLRVIDIAIDAAMRASDPRVLELFDRRAELVASLPAGALEALATRHAVASALSRDDQHAEATTLWTQLAEDPAAMLPAAGRRIALLAAAWSAAAAGDAKAELTARRKLADSDCAEVASTHAWRALELAAAVGEP
ncbi:MAG TPA: hypothetical protein VLB44_17925, partial [Kofleriaceae bacterium]|nr:hypothetical protein [Kofleriaceae bacterium]